MVVKVDKVPFEDALSMTGFGKYNAVSFGLCSIIIVGMAFEIFSVAYLVPASGCELGTSSQQQGLMAAVPLIGIIMTSHVWGYLADTRGRRKILILSMSIAFVSGSLAAFSPSWIVLSLLKFTSSAAVSGALALGLTLLSEYTPQDRRSGMILLTTSVFLSSAGVMAVITIPILPLKFSHYVPFLDIHLNSWRLLDMLFALPTLLAAIGVYYSYESPKFLLSVGKHEEALKVLQGIYSFNSGKGPECYRVSSVVLDEEGSSTTKAGFWASIKAQTLPMVRPPLLKDTLLLALLSVIVYFSINPFQVWVPFIMNAFMVSVNRGSSDLTLCEMIRQSMNETSTTSEPAEPCSMNQTAMLMVFGISALIAVLNLFTSVVVNRIGRRNLFIGLQLCGGTAALCINASSLWALSALCYVVFMCGVINFGTLTSLNVDVFPTHVKAMAICLTLMAGRGSAVLGINLLKRLLDVDCEAAFYLFGGIALGGGFLALLLPSEQTLRDRKAKLKDRFAHKQELTRI